MPTKLKVSRKRATNGPSPAGLFVNSAVTSSLPTRKPSAVPMDDDGFWDNDDDILAVAPPVCVPQPVCIFLGRLLALGLRTLELGGKDSQPGHFIEWCAPAVFIARRQSPTS